MRTLETPRLHLRTMRVDDDCGFAAYLQDGALCRMYGLPAEQDASVLRQIFASFCTGDKTYALIHRETETMVGHLMVVPPELPSPLPGTGVTLAFAVSPAHQRQGLMREALTAVIWDQFSHGVDYIHCGCFDFNEPSARLQEQLGFQKHDRHRLRDGRTIIDRLLRPNDL